MNTLQDTTAELFASEYEGKQLQIVYMEKSLWIHKEDILSLFGIEELVLDEELNTIFSDGIFTKNKNKTLLSLGEGSEAQIKEFYRLGVVISLGYRLKALTSTQYIVNTNRLIKKRFVSQQSDGLITNKKESLLEKQITFLSHALKYMHALRKTEISKRVYA